MHATAELDLIDFGDADTFQRLLEKHGLRYDGVRLNGRAPMHSWVSINGENTEFLTQCNPIDGDHVDPKAGDCDPGYASYVTITGDVPRARLALRDVLREAEYVKGMIRQLTAEDGAVVLVSED